MASPPNNADRTVAPADDCITWQVQQHRRQLARARAAIEQALQRLDNEVTHAKQLRESIRGATAGDANGRRRAALLRPLSLPAQAAAAARLRGELVKLIQQERRAWGLRPNELPPELAAPPAPRLANLPQTNEALERIRARVARFHQPPAAEPPQPPEGVS